MGLEKIFFFDFLNSNSIIFAVLASLIRPAPAESPRTGM